MKENLEHFVEWIKRPRTKKRLYLACAILVLCWVVYRFIAFGIMNSMHVYNPARAAAESGTVVAVLDVKQHDGVLYEPLTIKNNRAYVSGARASLIRAGQPVGDGVIVSVASSVDLDTGMYAVRTRGASDGLQYAQFRAHGYFVPVYALHNDAVMVAVDGIAVRRPVTVARRDSENAYITSGLHDGDQIIVSQIADGAKIKVSK